MRQAWPIAFALAAALAPAISIRFVSARNFDAARDVWLYAIGWFGAVASFSVSLPLGLISVAVMLHWRDWNQAGAVLTWAGIVVTWAIVQGLPVWALDVLQYGWRVAMLGLIAVGWRQRARKYEFKATTGSRIIFAALLVLVWPFTHPLEWPFYAYALWRTSSWSALAGLLAAIAVLYPVLLPATIAFAAMVAILFTSRWATVQILDRTPRGGSLDGLRQRWHTWKAMVRVTRQWPTWLVGWGPIPASRVGVSLEHELALEAVRLSRKAGNEIPLATSPTHCEPLELACTYGLLGAAAVVVLGYQLATRMTWGDPWSAAAVGGAMLSVANIPARAVPTGVVWLITMAVVVGRS